MDTYKRTWICRFCLSATEVEGEPPTSPPDRCEKCHVVSCDECGTFIKGDNPKFCHGCGMVFPKVSARHSAADSTGSIYMEDEWCRRNKGRYSDGEYVISSGYARDGSGRLGVWVSRKVGEKYEDVRELVGEELERYSNM